MHKIDDVNVAGQLYLSCLSAFTYITLKIAHTVDNQNIETASPLDT